MCGIVGYAGYQNAKNIVLDGLRTLEYRGYDSAGIALMSDEIELYKTAGNVDKLEQIIPPQLAAHTAIGHTRWATHGKPDAKNAHPHLSFDGEVAVVHNGVIENFGLLKNELVSRGVRFLSDTDSEIIAHMLALLLREGKDMLSAVDIVGARLRGAASFLAIRKGDNAIYMRRQGASLSIGFGNDENFVASDPVALSSYTQKFVALADGECAVLRNDVVQIFKNGKPIVKRVGVVSRKPPRRCNCQMLSEIEEIPSALKRTLASFRAFEKEHDIGKLFDVRQVYLVGCGTAYHACIYGKLALEEATGVPCRAIPAGEIDDEMPADKRTLAIFITQSGETADTLLALDRCKQNGARCLAITNAPQSSVTFKADLSLQLDAGAELAVAATKSYNCQLFALFLFAARLMGEDLSESDMDSFLSEVKNSSDLYDEKIKTANLFFVGKGQDYPTALEGALKFKEITYKMTDAYSATELKHGPIALIDGNSVCIIICCSERDKSRLAATVSELKARGAYTIAISSVGEIGGDKHFMLNCEQPLLLPILAIIPLQKLALSTSLALGYNPDRPRNLAKSVTVI